MRQRLTLASVNSFIRRAKVQFCSDDAEASVPEGLLVGPAPTRHLPNYPTRITQHLNAQFVGLTFRFKLDNVPLTHSRRRGSLPRVMCSFLSEQGSQACQICPTPYEAIGPGISRSETRARRRGGGTVVVQ